jgi:mxaD protein
MDMIIKMFAAVLLTMLAPLTAVAHGPTPQSAEERISIAASPDAVWAVIKDFASLASWHPLVAACTGKGQERTVTLKSGGVLVDSLDEYNDTGHRYAYRLLQENVEALPVSFYTATLTVKPTGSNGSEVIWSAHFYRGDTTNEPSEKLDDAAAVAAMKRFLSAGLQGLKERVEKR